MISQRKIQIGEIYMDKVSNQKIITPNQSRKYLLPCLKEYGEEFIQRLSNVFKVSVGIGDIICENSGLYHEKHLFILLDPSIAHSFFISFIDWIRVQGMYEDDYAFGNIHKVSSFHMVVIRFPEKFYDSFETFKLGKYSEMFSKETIESFFKNYDVERKVLIKDHDYSLVFTRKLNKIFGANLLPGEYTGELDFPPSDRSNKFNNHLKDK